MVLDTKNSFIYGIFYINAQAGSNMKSTFVHGAAELNFDELQNVVVRDLHGNLLAHCLTCDFCYYMNYFWQNNAVFDVEDNERIFWEVADFDTRNRLITGDADIISDTSFLQKI